MDRSLIRDLAEARKSTDRPEGPGERLRDPAPIPNPSPNPTPHPHEVTP